MEDEIEVVSPAEHLEHVEKLLDESRVDKSNLFPIIQCISLESQSNSDLRLMEVNSDVIEELAEGKILAIRGELHEPAVLCTSSKTYEIRETETSNSLLIATNLLFPEDFPEPNELAEKTIIPKEVKEIFHTYYELRPCPPKLKKLSDLLKNSQYYGKEYEDPSIRKYTFDDLLHYIQASKGEIESLLFRMHACEINGYIRLLDFEYKFEVFSRIIDLLDSESISVYKIPKEFAVHSLEDIVPRQILEQIFVWYAKKADFHSEDDHDFYTLKEDEVCQIYGEVLLRPMAGFRLPDFLNAWQKSVPEEMTTSLSQLKGRALCNLNTGPQIISYFSALDLPDDINERFDKLFKVRPRWTFEEIEPYLKDVTLVNQDAIWLLVKYTKYYSENGVRIFCSKW